MVNTADACATLRVTQGMSNKNYVRGRQFEYRCMAFFRKLGYYVMRSYASKGLLDIVCIPPKNQKEGYYNETIGIQAKLNGYVKPEERDMLKFSEPKWQMKIYIAWNDKGKLKFRTLEGQEVSHDTLDILGIL